MCLTLSVLREEVLLYVLNMYIVDNCTVHSKYINKLIIYRVMWTFLTCQI